MPAGVPCWALQLQETPSAGQALEQILLHLTADYAGCNFSGAMMTINQEASTVSSLPLFPLPNKQEHICVVSVTRALNKHDRVGGEGVHHWLQGAHEEHRV